MSPILRKPKEVEFELQDKVSIGGVPGWVRMKIRTTPPLYRVQTERELSPEMTGDQLTLVERFEGERLAV
jgi:hypothetical protein